MTLKRETLSEREAEKVLVYYFVDYNNVVIRKWQPSTVLASHKWSVVYQVVILLKYRKGILMLGHNTPLAGHLEIDKTYHNFLATFISLECTVMVKLS